MLVKIHKGAGAKFVTQPPRAVTAVVVVVVVVVVAVVNGAVKKHLHRFLSQLHDRRPCCYRFLPSLSNHQIETKVSLDLSLSSNIKHQINKKTMDNIQQFKVGLSVQSTESDHHQHAYLGDSRAPENQ